VIFSYTENGFLTPNTINQRENPPNSTPQLNAAQTTVRGKQTENNKTPQGPLSDDPDPQDRAICHPTNPPQPWRTSPRKPVKITQKQGMTEGETRDASTFPPQRSEVMRILFLMTFGHWSWNTFSLLVTFGHWSWNACSLLVTFGHWSRKAGS